MTDFISLWRPAFSNYLKNSQIAIERHSGERRNPGFSDIFWTPTFAGVTVQASFGIVS